MPIYEYLCSRCDHKFELMRPMSKAAESGICPKCGESAERALSMFCRSYEGSTSGGANGCGTCSSNACSSCSR
jgi:putative FmdB family regulatory protein